MINLSAILQAVEHIETHLREPMPVASVAAAVSYSVYHFCRTFNQATHHSPYDHIMRRRLSEAACDLVRSERRIIDVALDYQFNSPETFARAFKRFLGQQPNQWRRERRLDPLRLMPRLTLAHLERVAGGAYTPPVMEARPTLRLAGLMALIPGDDPGPIEALWALLDRELAAPAAPPRAAEYYGLRYYPDGWAETGYFYLAGVETAGQVDAPGLVVKTFPPGSYACFTHTGPWQDLPLTLDYIYHTWLPNSGARLLSG
ncbi:MAG: AraC family transcriptional regulator [Anaerolineae bacterium]|jgi:AraC family transcriptional regulator|nr:AraC family transcriptional regulator [Anaerolineae bacterium]